MPNIGNDIVDLRHPEAVTKWDDRRFVNRVFTMDEQEQIRSSACPDICLWMFWAAKESAYKAVSRSLPLVSASPRLYEVFLIDRESPSIVHGTIKTPETPVQFQAVIEEDFVHCLGISGLTWDFHRIETGIYQVGSENEIGMIMPEQESLMVRKLACKRIAAHVGVSPSEVQIRRERAFNQPGPPEVFIQGEKSTIRISLSHDGRFVAYSFSGLEA